jgi:hypothetical protein
MELYNLLYRFNEKTLIYLNSETVVHLNNVLPFPN